MSKSAWRTGRQKRTAAEWHEAAAGSVRAGCQEKALHLERGRALGQAPVGCGPSTASRGRPAGQQRPPWAPTAAWRRRRAPGTPVLPWPGRVALREPEPCQTPSREGRFVPQSRRGVEGGHSSLPAPCSAPSPPCRRSSFPPRRTGEAAGPAGKAALPAGRKPDEAPRACSEPRGPCPGAQRRHQVTTALASPPARRKVPSRGLQDPSPGGTRAPGGLRARLLTEIRPGVCPRGREGAAFPGASCPP